GGAACSDPSAPTPGRQGAPTVCAVNYPLAYFARRIAPPAIEVQFPAPPDVDPAFWTPTDEQIAGYQAADLVLLNGAAYAKWTQRVSLPPSRLVDTSRAFGDRLIEIEDAETHAHGPEGAHAHGTIAFTTWLDPALALDQASAVAGAMCATWPEHCPAIEAARDDLAGDLHELSQALEQYATREQPPLLASHPVYQYLARRAGMNLRSLHWEPDQVPADDEWTALDALLAEHPARWMIWEATPDAETAAALATRGVGVIVFEPCGSAPADGDYLDVMRRNVERLGAAY
ncbi:MAG: zinc ABC transporter substrate-binding protein, partial [Planctomycetes bacterium]|nr:zinc ABC transporter substrate-binding protein [Planctomycetota bacterium]